MEYLLKLGWTKTRVAGVYEKDNYWAMQGVLGTFIAVKDITHYKEGLEKGTCVIYQGEPDDVTGLIAQTRKLQMVRGSA